MKVNEKDMQTIWFDDKSESVRIIDQTLLPFKLKIKDLKTFNDSVNAIKDMLICPLITDNNPKEKEATMPKEPAKPSTPSIKLKPLVITITTKTVNKVATISGSP